MVQITADPLAFLRGVWIKIVTPYVTVICAWNKAFADYPDNRKECMRGRWSVRSTQALTKDATSRGEPIC